MEIEMRICKHDKLVILKMKLKTFCKTFSIIKHSKPQKYVAKISRDLFDPFLQIRLKNLRGILNSAISFRWSHQRSRASIHISGLPSERRKICFPGVGNGNGTGGGPVSSSGFS